MARCRRSLRMQCRSTEGRNTNYSTNLRARRRVSCTFERAAAPNKKRDAIIHFGTEETNSMRRFFTRALATGILFGAVLILLSSRPLAAADDTPAFRQANHSLAEALANGDKKAAAALLD